eukprot:TRINITY_DN22337_c0_g1_i1.p1 TRINITY_DN22337_c0_g1~~TRINITY_DN22337_c0_g1_i1.p1  ORF type:complete len:794 (+),score=134.37 TRINITY_DN22337_c0_g1_i1:47-2383(+)
MEVGAQSDHPQRSIETAWMKERKHYIKRHNLHRMLGDVTDTCLRSMPAAPMLFMAEQLLRQFTQTHSPELQRRLFSEDQKTAISLSRILETLSQIAGADHPPPPRDDNRTPSPVRMVDVSRAASPTPPSFDPAVLTLEEIDARIDARIQSSLGRTSPGATPAKDKRFSRSGYEAAPPPSDPKAPPAGPDESEGLTASADTAGVVVDDVADQPKPAAEPAAAPAAEPEPEPERQAEPAEPAPVAAPAPEVAAQAQPVVVEAPTQVVAESAPVVESTESVLESAHVADPSPSAEAFQPAVESAEPAVVESAPALKSSEPSADASAVVASAKPAVEAAEPTVIESAPIVESAEPPPPAVEAVEPEETKPAAPAAEKAVKAEGQPTDVPVAVPESEPVEAKEVAPAATEVVEAKEAAPLATEAVPESETVEVKEVAPVPEVGVTPEPESKGVNAPKTEATPLPPAGDTPPARRATIKSLEVEGGATSTPKSQSSPATGLGRRRSSAAEWEECKRQSDGAVFWYNRKKNEKTWTKPSEVLDAEDTAASDWVQLGNPEQGQVWFYNTRSGMKQWHRPSCVGEDAAVPPLDAKPPSPGRKSFPYSGRRARLSEDAPDDAKEGSAPNSRDATPASKDAAGSPKSTMKVVPLDEGWTMYQPAEGPSYFIDGDGNKQWCKPDCVKDPLTRDTDWAEYDYQNRPYFVNKKLQERTWARDRVAKIIKSGTGKKGKVKARTDPKSKVDIGSGWVRYTTVDSRDFYVNQSTGEKRWDLPTGVEASDTPNDAS